MTNYHKILGVTSHATLDQIKKAYRKKAKLLHPDVNKSDNAKEEFILINEAYEYLLQTTGNSTNRIKRAQEQAKKRAEYHRNWEQQEREKARARAQEYARMKYEAYIKSDIYKTTEALNVIADFFATLLVLLLVIGLPILSYREHGPVSLILCALILLPTSPVWFRFLVRTFSKINLQNLFNRKKATIRSKMMSITILFLINVIIFFRIALQTLIELHWIFTIYVIALTIGYVTSKTFKGAFNKYMIRLNIAPGIVGFLFLINFVFSSNPKQETYWFSYNYNSAPIFVSIKLEGNAYQEYRGMRLFGSKETLEGNNCIKYTFKDGLLGYRVVFSSKLSTDFLTL
ncbi:hypothetical protein E9993_15845 [Labilibacter sediminis]|nr:hypothetical protein E9993_15845 [Labilibacter sediminis]